MRLFKHKEMLLLITLLALVMTFTPCLAQRGGRVGGGGGGVKHNTGGANIKSAPATRPTERSEITNRDRTVIDADRRTDVDINKDININRDIDIDRNIDVDVDVHGHGWDYYRDWDDDDNDAFWWATAGFVLGAAIARPPAYQTVVYANPTYYYNEGVYMVPQAGTTEVVIVPAPVGATIPSLPPGYVDVNSAGATYYYANGVFYRSANGKYVVIQAPSGVAVPMVPKDAKSVVVDGATYYEYNGVRYLPVLAQGQTVYVVQ